MNPYSMPANRDPDLWRQARRRAKFKASLLPFLYVNALLWGLWVLTDRTAHPVPWPLWATGFWGLALLARAFDVYGSPGRMSLAEREYERLLRQR